MSWKVTVFVIIACVSTLTHGWIKDVDNYVVKRTPDRIEKMRSPLSIYPLLMWSALRFPQMLNKDYLDNKRSDEENKLEQSKAASSFDGQKRQNRAGLDPLASGLIG